MIFSRKPVFSVESSQEDWSWKRVSLKSCHQKSQRVLKETLCYTLKREDVQFSNKTTDNVVKFEDEMINRSFMWQEQAYIIVFYHTCTELTIDSCWIIQSLWMVSWLNFNRLIVIFQYSAPTDMSRSIYRWCFGNLEFKLCCLPEVYFKSAK